MALSVVKLLLVFSNVARHLRSKNTVVHTNLSSTYLALRASSCSSTVILRIYFVLGGRDLHRFLGLSIDERQFSSRN